MTVPCDHFERSASELEKDRRSLERTRPQYGPNEIAGKLRRVNALVGRGFLVAEAVRRIGVSDSTYYRWLTKNRRQIEHGTSDPEQAQRMRRLELENTRLRRAVAELVIEKQALKEGILGLA